MTYLQSPLRHPAHDCWIGSEARESTSTTFGCLVEEDGVTVVAVGQRFAGKLAFL